MILLNLSYRKRFLYLATILDAFTREIIAWNISSRHNKELITATLIDAINKRNSSPQIFHSDQGSEYRSNNLIDILKTRNIKSSMSKKASPWENGKQESFYQKFKFELDDFNDYPDQGELIEAIALQIPLLQTTNESTLHLKCHQWCFIRDLMRQRI